jgi:hypothetical protein
MAWIVFSSATGAGSILLHVFPKTLESSKCTFHKPNTLFSSVVVGERMVPSGSCTGLFLMGPKIASLATIIVRIRPGVIMPTEQEFVSQLGKELGVLPKVIFVAGPPYLDVSSSLLKERVINNKSIRYLLPRAVEVYIQQKKLYLS